MATGLSFALALPITALLFMVSGLKYAMIFSSLTMWTDQLNPLNLALNYQNFFLNFITSHGAPTKIITFFGSDVVTIGLICVFWIGGASMFLGAAWLLQKGLNFNRKFKSIRIAVTKVMGGRIK